MDVVMENKSKASVSWISNNNKKVTQIYMQALFNLFLAFGRTLTLTTTSATKFWIREFRDLWKPLQINRWRNKTSKQLQYLKSSLLQKRQCEACLMEILRA